MQQINTTAERSAKVLFVSLRSATFAGTEIGYMKKEKLFNAIGQIDENLIADAFEEKRLRQQKEKFG